MFMKIRPCVTALIIILYIIVAYVIVLHKLDAMFVYLLTSKVGQEGILIYNLLKIIYEFCGSFIMREKVSYLNK